MLFINSKSQASVADFVLGLLIIVVASVLAFKMILSINSSSDFDNLKRQSLISSQYLLSEGFPANWNSSSVIVPGVLSDGVFNSSKWLLLQSMSYDYYRPLIAGFYDFYAYLLYPNGSVINVSSCGVGSPDVPVNNNCVPDFSFVNNLNDKNVVRVLRIVNYNNTVASLILVLW